MKATAWTDRVLFVICGIVIALAGVYFFNSTQPVSASATDRSDDVIICTGLIDNDGEGVFVLDTVTGDLKGWVLDSRSGQFTTGYGINVLEPMGINLNSNPKFAMVTGAQTFRPARGQSQFASTVIYISESTTGTIAAFAVPWNSNRRSNATPTTGVFQLLHMQSFRDQGAIR